MSRTSSTCETSRSSPRMVPSTSRRYRSFSPSFILQSVITILQIAIGVNREHFDRWRIASRRHFERGLTRSCLLLLTRGCWMYTVALHLGARYGDPGLYENRDPFRGRVGA